MSSGNWRHGLIVGKFYPLHIGHSHLIHTALAQCDRVTIELLASRVESVSIVTREGWLQTEYPLARVVSAYDEAVVDFESPAAWDEHMIVIESLLDAPVDAVFTSDDYGAELARRLGATWVQVDPGRKFNPVSGRSIRADFRAHLHHVVPSVLRTFESRILDTHDAIDFSLPLELREQAGHRR